MKYILIILLISVLTMSSTAYSQGEFPVLEGPYLGQKPPGLIPEVFAPGIVSTENWEIEGVFAPDMKEFYFTRQKLGGGDINIHTMLYKNGAWRQSVPELRSGEISISPDGRTMYLGNKYKDRATSGWSEEKSLGPQFDKFPIMRLTASAAGTYVFDERTEEQIGIIRYSRLIDGKREEPKEFSKEINTEKKIGHPFIAPDESYLIWDGERKGGYGNSDLYISFRQKDDSWGPAINLGEDINAEHEESYGSITPDGKYFFFHRIEWTVVDGKRRIKEANIFWVDAQIIEKLRHK